MTETSDSRKDFKKVINDLVSDILTTFPELKDRMNEDLINPDEEGLNREIKLQKPNLLGDFDYWDNYSFTLSP